MKTNSKSFVAVILSVILVFSMAAVAVFSAVAEDMVGATGEGVTGETATEAIETETSEKEETTAAPVVDDETTEAPVVDDEITVPPQTDEPSDDPGTTAPAQVEVGKMGDLNGDGKVNAADARLVLRYCARLETPNALQSFLADVDGDHLVRAADARILLRHAARLQVYTIILEPVYESSDVETGASVVYETAAE